MFKDDLLKGKRILVTGGGSGLGKEMSRYFLKYGAEVLICGRRVGVLEDTVAEIQETMPDLEPLKVELQAIQTKIEDNDLGHLQGKLAELSTLLTTIQARQQEVLDNAATSNAKVATMEKDWIEVRNEYKKMADAIKGFEESVARFKKEVDDLWKGLDAASSPLG